MKQAARTKSATARRRSPAPRNASAPASTVRRTQAQRSADSHARILAAAAALFGEQGYVNTTMEQIGKRAGCSAGLVARKFGAKAGVVEELLHQIRRNTVAATGRGGERSGQRTSARAAAGRNAAPVAAVQAYVDLIASGNVWSRALYVLMAESLGPLQEMVQLFAQHNRAFIAAIEAHIVHAQNGRQTGALVNAHSVAVETVARIRGATLLWLIDPGGIDLAALNASLIQSLRTALRRKS